MNLRQKVFGGFFWVAVSSLSVRVLGFASGAVLAQLLPPRDFGLIQIALVFVSLSTILAEFGLGEALIQWVGDVHKAAYTGFFLNTVLSLAAALALFALAPTVARFYQTAKLAWVIRGLALNTAISGLGVVPGSLLERELAFRRKTFAEVLPQVCYALVAIGLALAAHGVWSLVAGLIASTLLRTALLWQCAGLRPKLRFDRVVARRLVSFGGYLVFISLLLFAATKMDVAYLGRMTDPTQVGFYGLALSITALGVDLTTSLFGRVTFPVFSRLQEETRQVGRAYLRAMSYSAYAALPMIFGIFAVAPWAVIGIYGAKWGPAVPLTRILCLFALFRTLARLVGTVFTATGRPDVTTKIIVVRVSLFGLLLLVLGSRWHARGVAWAAGFSMAVSGVWSIWLVNRHLSIPHRRFVSAIALQMGAAAVMCVGVTLTGMAMETSVVSLALLVALGVALYVGLLAAFGGRPVRRDLDDILALLRERLPRTREVQ